MADYLDATRIRTLATQLNLRPSKGRGQNFLFDANTVRRIVNLAELTPDDTVLEIGPGLGSLTVGLLHAGPQVVAVEIEPVLARQLPLTMAELVPDKVKNLTVLELDALKLTPESLSPMNQADSPGSIPSANGSFARQGLPPQNPPSPMFSSPSDTSSLAMNPPSPDLLATASPPPTMLVANLPYNISVPVILHILAAFPTIERGLVMVQLEVADRLAAPPGSRVYGVPSAKLAWYAAASRVGTVPATVFWPAPNVESGLVRFSRHDPPSGSDRETTFALIDAAFSQRRKMLRSVLSGTYGPAIHTALEQAGISPQARGETLSINDFSRLASCFRQLSVHY